MRTDYKRENQSHALALSRLVIMVLGLISMMITIAHADGTVTVTKSGRVLVINGDNESNKIELKITEGGDTVEVIGLEGTDVTGPLEFPLALNPRDRISTRLRGGDDEMQITINERDPELYDFSFQGGSGRDLLSIICDEDQAFFCTLHVEKRLQVNGGGGKNDIVTFDRTVFVGRKLSVYNGFEFWVLAGCDGEEITFLNFQMLRDFIEQGKVRLEGEAFRVLSLNSQSEACN